MTRRMNAKKISKSILALLITVPALLATNAMAQELKKPTLEDLIPSSASFTWLASMNLKLPSVGAVFCTCSTGAGCCI